jgi:hypothetical protein
MELKRHFFWARPSSILVRLEFIFRPIERARCILQRQQKCARALIRSTRGTFQSQLRPKAVFVIFVECRSALFRQDFFDVRRKINFRFFLVDVRAGFYSQARWQGKRE